MFKVFLKISNLKQIKISVFSSSYETNKIKITTLCIYLKFFLEFSIFLADFYLKFMCINS